MKWIKNIGVIFAIVLLLAATWLYSRPTMEEVGIPYAPAAPIDSSAITVKWFGISTLLIDDGETQILTDGFFSRPSLFDLALKRPIEPELPVIKQVIDTHRIDRLAVIIPVHSHYDHAMDSGEVAKLTGASLLGSQSTAYAGRSSDLSSDKITVAETGKPYTYGQFRVTLFDSKHAPLPSNAGIDGKIEEVFHTPAPYTAWQLGKAYTVLVEHPKGSFLVQGSAGFIPGALKGLEVDAVFLGTGGLSMLPHEYRQSYIYETVTLTKPKTVYTIHHDTLLGPLGNVEQNPLIAEYDELRAFEMTQLISPARFEQLRYAEAVEIIPHQVPSE
ncbi:MAG: MBL fold metallo-hydrolase [Cellvibrionaceae bacterium]